MTDQVDRPAIPSELRRRVLVEAGYRCSIPTCRMTPTEIAHIVPWAECRSHEFGNLIVLCPTCHTRYDRKEIDRKAMRIFKSNLGMLSGRYSDFERRMLDQMAQTRTSSVRLPVGYRPLLFYLIRDGLLSEPRLLANMGNIMSGGIPMVGVDQYDLTDPGREFLASYATARSLLPDELED